MNSSQAALDHRHLSRDAAASGEWALDPSVSRLDFTAKTMWGLVAVRGRFGKLEGTAHVDEDGRATATLVVDASSVETNLERRDDHLRSPDFFDAATHRYMTARVSEITFTSASTARASGELTVAGRTEPLSFEAHVAPTAGGDEAVVQTSLHVAHRRFGITPGLLHMVRPVTQVTSRLVFHRIAAPPESAGTL